MAAPHFLPISISLPGSAHVLEMKRVQEYRTTIVPQKGTPTCDAFLINPPNAAVKLKGSIFQILYRWLSPRLGHNQTIGVVAHKLCRLIWMILHQGIRYEERRPAVSERSRRLRYRAHDPHTPTARVPS